jgi:16S rRNA (guanine966-N2)-methyltransferase
LPSVVPRLETDAMRIIAGSARGRRLKSAPGAEVRPTADRVKEALFSILASRFDLDGAAVLDLFAGTGALGIEALSRGARRAVFVEHRGATVATLLENLRACGFEDRAELRRADVARALRDLAERGERFDGILADPPYGRAIVEPLIAQVADSGVLRPGGWLIVEHHVDEPIGGADGALRLTRSRRYGKTALSLFEADEGEQGTAT